MNTHEESGRITRTCFLLFVSPRQGRRYRMGRPWGIRVMRWRHNGRPPILLVPLTMHTGLANTKFTNNQYAEFLNQVAATDDFVSNDPRPVQRADEDFP